MKPMTKIATGALTAALLSLSLAASAQDVTLPQAPAAESHISGAQVAKNVFGGAVLGKIVGNVIGGNSDRGAVIGLLGGIGKSIYEDQQEKKAAEAAKTAAGLKNVAGLPPVVDATATPVAKTDKSGGVQVMPVADAKELKAPIAAFAEPLKVVSSSQLEYPTGRSPNPSITTKAVKGKGEVITISGNSSLDMVYGLGALLKTKYGVSMDVLSSDAAAMKQESQIKMPQSITIDATQGRDGVLNAVKVLTKERGMGAIYEDYAGRNDKPSGYLFVGGREVTQSLAANPGMHEISRTAGITSSDVSAYLQTYKPSVAKNTYQAANMQYTQPQGSFAHEGLSRKEVPSQRGFRQ
jgi:hypothetical protein